MESNAVSQGQPSNPKPRREKRAMNGVDVPTLFATINAVGEQPEEITDVRSLDGESGWHPLGTRLGRAIPHHLQDVRHLD